MLISLQITRKHRNLTVFKVCQCVMVWHKCMLTWQAIYFQHNLGVRPPPTRIILRPHGVGPNQQPQQQLHHIQLQQQQQQQQGKQRQPEHIKLQDFSGSQPSPVLLKVR